MAPLQRNLLIAGVVLLCLAPYVVYPLFLIKLMCFALLAASLNLLIGYVGLLSFGHAMFYGASSYVTGHVLKTFGVDGVVGLLAGVGIAAALGFLTGLLAIRRQGIYFSMITLAFAQMVYFLALRLPFTGGEDGLQSVPRPNFLGVISTENNLAMYYTALVLVGFGFWLIYRIIYSPFGQVLKSIRDNEPRALSLGYQVNRYKLIAFTLSAALAGLAGATKTLVFVSATLSDATWQMSGLVILMTLIGGLGTLTGPILGAFIVVLMENKVGDFGQMMANLTGVDWFLRLGESVTIVIGLIFVICVLAFRRGIVGEVGAFIDRRRAARA